MSRIQHLLALTCGLAIFAGLAPSAYADGGVFARIETGTADTAFDSDRIGIADSSDDDRSFAVRGGYYFNSHVAVEGFYSPFYDAQIAGPQNFVFLGTEAKLRAYGAGVVGKWRFGEDRGVYIQGRAGMASVEGETAITFNLCANALGCPQTQTTKQRTTEPYFGVAVGYDFNEHVGLGLHYDILNADFDSGLSTDTRNLGVGVEYRF